MSDRPTIREDVINQDQPGALPLDEHGKAKTIRLRSLRRPHMRAFHYAWLSFFLAFFGWFALAPLQNRIQKDGKVDGFEESNFKAQNTIAIAGTILMRFLIGPFCDRFGPRLAQSLLIGVFSIPVLLVATAYRYWQWVTARFFIGFIGATFVVTQFWTSVMFSSNIVGTANATSAGWGNLGGGVTQAIMPLIRALMERAVKNTSSLNDKDAFDKSWRLAMIWPGFALLIFSIIMYLTSDDLPQGRYSDLHKAGTKEKTNPFKAFGRAALNWRSWVLHILYGACFGVELVMNGNLAKYFAEEKEPFGLGEATAGLVAGLFGIMNLFARSLGGIFSDVLAHKFGMRGRLWAFFIVELLDGVFFVIFSQMRHIAPGIVTLILFSIFVQMAEGATFGIVPFVDPPVTGAVSGIVGAGGNVGAVVGNLLVNPGQKLGISNGFRNIGFLVMGVSLLVPTLWWPQFGSMFTKPTMTTKVIDDEEVDEPSTNPSMHNESLNPRADDDGGTMQAAP